MKMNNPNEKPPYDLEERTELRDAAVPLWQEAKERTLIFASIWRI